MHRIDDDEPVSSGSKMSGEYSLDERKYTSDGRASGRMTTASKKSPTKEPTTKPSGKLVSCKVFLLDGESVQINIDKNDLGKVLLDKVCNHLDLIERDYFGLTFTDDRLPGHLKAWVNIEKKVSKQIQRSEWTFEFALKFYPPDPSQLREYLTRWLVVLQVRRDLLSGKIPCTFSTYALLGSYSVQADIHDYEPATHGNSFDYIRDMTFAPNQTPELLEKIAELHRMHKGLEPKDADKNFLDNAKKLAMYGVDVHKAKDSVNQIVMIGVCCSGLLVLRDKLRLNRFVWPKILKLSYKRNHFYIKIRPGETERGETTMMVKLDTHRLAKRLWKTCVEHHAFFRLREAEKPDHNLTFPRFGSKFRYSGRTLYENKNAPVLNRPRHYFERPSPTKNSKSLENVADNSYDGYYYPDDYSFSKKDARDKKYTLGSTPVLASAGRDEDSWHMDEGSTMQKRPFDTSTVGSRGRLPSHDDVRLELERKRGKGDDSASLLSGGTEQDPSAWEQRKREKENEKKRKEAKLNRSEDRINMLGLAGTQATQTASRPGSGTMSSKAGQTEPLHLFGPPYGKDGFNNYGYDKDGYDRDGYNKDGFDRRGNKSPYAPPFGKDGFNEFGYDKDGYDRDGYDKDGYDRNDVDIKGRKKPYAEPYGKDGFNGNGYGRDGYDRDGFDKNAFDKDGYSKRGKRNPYGPPYDRFGLNDNGFNKHGLDPDGFDKDGYDKHDLDSYGRKNPYAPPFDKEGYNENGFDKHGFDKGGYDKDGFDLKGFDRFRNKSPYGPPYGKDGFNKNGYDMEGYDRDGYDKDGYDRDNYDIKGRKKPYMAPYGRDGFNSMGYGPDGFDRDGYDKNAFDPEGLSKRGRRNPYGPPYDKYGFNENSFNKHGLDPDGFDKDGYDKNDLDINGRKNLYAPPYDKEGYNQNGYDKHGFDRSAYDKDGFDKNGLDRFGNKFLHGPPYGKDGFNKNGYDKDGYDRDGYDKDGYDRDNYDIKGRKKPYMAPYGRDGFNSMGYGPDGFDRDGYDKNAFDREGHSKRGRRNPYGPPYDKYGFNENSFNKHGLDPDGFDKDGYDKNDLDRYGRLNPYAPPYDEEGYNKFGFDKHGFDRDGYDKDGFDQDGFDRNGRKTPYGPPFGKDGFNKNGFDREGFDRNGFDKDGYDRYGLDKDGFDRHGLDHEGNPRTDRLNERMQGAAGSKTKGPMELVMGQVDKTGVVGQEKTVDNKVQCLPLSTFVKVTKNQLKPAYSDNYFNPPSTSTLNRSKVPPPVPPKGGHSAEDGSKTSASSKDVTNRNSPIPNMPVGQSGKRSVTYKQNNYPYELDDCELVSAHSHSSKMQIIETTTYKTEKNGIVETKMEQRYTVSLEGDEEFDYDSALADAIRSVTEFNPDVTVEHIECFQHLEDERNGERSETPVLDPRNGERSGTSVHESTV